MSVCVAFKKSGPRRKRSNKVTFSTDWFCLFIGKEVKGITKFGQELVLKG